MQLRAQTRDGSTVEYDSCAASPCKFVGAAARAWKCDRAQVHIKTRPRPTDQHSDEGTRKPESRVVDYFEAGPKRPESTPHRCCRGGLPMRPSRLEAAGKPPVRLSGWLWVLADKIVERVVGTCVACCEDIQRGRNARDEISVRHEDAMDSARYTRSHARTRPPARPRTHARMQPPPTPAHTHTHSHTRTRAHSQTCAHTTRDLPTNRSHCPGSESDRLATRCKRSLPACHC